MLTKDIQIFDLRVVKKSSIVGIIRVTLSRPIKDRDMIRLFHSLVQTKETTRIDEWLNRLFATILFTDVHLDDEEN